MTKVFVFVCSMLIASTLSASSSDVTLDDAIKALELAIKDIKNQRTEINRLKNQISEMNLTIQSNDVSAVRKQVASLEQRQKTVEKQSIQLKTLFEARPRLGSFSVENVSADKDSDRKDVKGVFYKVVEAVRIREDADIGSKTLGVLEMGKPVEITDIKNTYGYMGKGWVQMKYLKKVGK